MGGKASEPCRMGRVGVKTAETADPQEAEKPLFQDSEQRETIGSCSLGGCRYIR